MLLNKTLYKVSLFFISYINLSYLVNWFLSFSYGDESDIFTIEESISLSNKGYRTSLPNLQLFRISYFTDERVRN